MESTIYTCAEIEATIERYIRKLKDSFPNYWKEVLLNLIAEQENIKYAENRRNESNTQPTGMLEQLRLPGTETVRNDTERHLRGERRPEVFPIREDGGVANKSQTEAHGNRKRVRGNYPQTANTISRRYYKDGSENLIAVQLTEARTEEAKRIRRETKDRDFSPRRGKKLVPRVDNMANTVTANQSNEGFLLTGQDKHGVMISNPKLNNYTGSSEYSVAITATSYKEPPVVNSIRRLTPTECERLQGFPDDWTKYGTFEDGETRPISDSQKYKCAGNAVTTNVVQAIIERIPEFDTYFDMFYGIKGFSRGIDQAYTS